MKYQNLSLATLVALLSLVNPLSADAAEYLTGVEWQEPPLVTPGKACGDAPSDAHGAHPRPAQCDRRRAAADGSPPVGAQGMAPDGEHLPRSTRDRVAAG